LAKGIENISFPSNPRKHWQPRASRAITIKLKIDRVHLFRSLFSHSHSARRVRAVTRIGRAYLCA